MLPENVEFEVVGSMRLTLLPSAWRLLKGLSCYDFCCKYVVRKCYLKGTSVNGYARCAYRPKRAGSKFWRMKNKKNQCFRGRHQKDLSDLSSQVLQKYGYKSGAYESSLDRCT